MIEHATVDVDGVGTFVRRVSGAGPPAVFVHGNPTHSAEWLPFLERVAGPAVAFDLPGWGRSDRPDPGRFDGTMHGLAAFVERLLAELGIDDHRLVVHDWGGVALLAALREPDRVRRAVIMDTVPFLPGYRWHWVARVWRTPLLGELFNAASTRWSTAVALRRASGDGRPMPREFVDMIWRHFDPGTRRAILQLYRSAPVEALEAAGSRLAELRCPALVVWGAGDPYLPIRFGRAYAERLPNAELLELSGAGHWPWIDRPDVVDQVVGFIDGG